MSVPSALHVALVAIALWAANAADPDFWRAAGMKPSEVVAGVPIFKHAAAGSASTQVKNSSKAKKWVVVLASLDSAGIAFWTAPRGGTKVAASSGPGANGGLPFVVVECTETLLKSKLEGTDKNVRFVEEDGQLTAIGEATSDAEESVAAPITWGLDRVDRRKGLDGSFRPVLTGAGVNAYVFDTGIMIGHTDFEGRAVAALDATLSPMKVCAPTDRLCAADRNGHGSHCAGTVGGKRYGVAKAAKLHAVKVLGDDGRGSFSGFMQAVNWVALNGARPAVISASLSAQGRSAAVLAAVDFAVSRGVIVVVAAGNNGKTALPNACSYAPAFVPSAITVAATTPTDARAAWSNFGNCVDIFAPGERITSVGIGSTTAFATYSGTSMACPHVAGAAALLLGQNPKLTPAQARDLLVSRATAGAVTDPGAGSPNRFLFVDSANTVAAAPCSPSGWRVQSGRCTIADDGCALSPNFPRNYTANELCLIEVCGNLGPLAVQAFRTEASQDYLFVNGRGYSGTAGPTNVVPSGEVRWTSDGSTQGSGWRICPRSLQPAPASSEAQCVGSGWQIISGPCTVSPSNCAKSPSHPKPYGASERCVLEPCLGLGPISATAFETQPGRDILWVNRAAYSGRSGPKSIRASGRIYWSSDNATQLSGWQLCPSSTG